MMPRVLVINPNCSQTCTDGIDEAVSHYRWPGGPAIDVVGLGEGSSDAVRVERQGLPLAEGLDESGCSPGREAAPGPGWWSTSSWSLAAALRGF